MIKERPWDSWGFGPWEKRFAYFPVLAVGVYAGVKYGEDTPAPRHPRLPIRLIWWRWYETSEFTSVSGETWTVRREVLDSTNAWGLKSPGYPRKNVNVK